MLHYIYHVYSIYYILGIIFLFPIYSNYAVPLALDSYGMVIIFSRLVALHLRYLSNLVFAPEIPTYVPYDKIGVQYPCTDICRSHRDQT